MTHGMVSAPQPEAVEAGLDILSAGGNAIDAAIGAALVQTVVDPQHAVLRGREQTADRVRRRQAQRVGDDEALGAEQVRVDGVMLDRDDRQRGRADGARGPYEAARAGVLVPTSGVLDPA